MGCDTRYFCDICGETVGSGWALHEVIFNARTYDICNKCDEELRKFITEKIEEGRKYHGRYEDDLR